MYKVDCFKFKLSLFTYICRYKYICVVTYTLWRIFISWWALISQAYNCKKQKVRLCYVFIVVFKNVSEYFVI